MNVSLVIPTYNGKKLLEKNIPTVLAALRPKDELIVVDDASTDDSVEWLKSFFGCHNDECLPNQSTGDLPEDMLCYLGKRGDVTVKIIVNSKNERFGVSCNRGVREAGHEIAILLNNDVAPAPDFIASLLPHFDVSSVFAVGCKELASAEANKEYGRNEGSFKRGFYVHRRCDDQDSEVTAWVVGGSGAFRRSMWMTLGGFDIDFKPAYGEDIDLSFRAKQKGWQVVFEPKSIVYHNHESTNITVFGQREIEIVSFKNAILFMWKTAPFGERLLHFMWLPYHLVFTTLRSHGNFLRGFSRAIQTIVNW